MARHVWGDTDKMPFGVHKGKLLIQIPDSYFVWLWENDRAGRLKKYIEENVPEVQKKVQENKSIK